MKKRGRTDIIKVRLLFFVMFLCLFPIQVFSSDANTFIDKANQLNLASDPFWLDLLHFKGKRSQILDESFFLSDQGMSDAQAELNATLKVYFTQQHDLKREWGDSNIKCIFPARYMWLNEKLQLPDYKNDASVCPGLSEWARLNDVEAISLIFVSGYLGNPASSFGHVLLNFKLRGNEQLEGLFNTSISYGAEVPVNENMIVYILKGLFGGYKASFVDKFFYTHDQVYSNREFRDMWEYTLALSDDDRQMLIYHMAELLTKNYQYYFLSANCAQRVAIFLDTFISENVYNFNYPIYLPETLFHRLQHIDGNRKADGDQKIIESIKYIPSAQRHLYYQTNQLSKAELKVYKDINKSSDDDWRYYFEDIDVDSRINVLNALLAYQHYKLMASDEEDADQKLKEYKDKILFERLKLPSRKNKKVEIPQVPSSQDVSPPSTVNVGFVVKENGDSFTTLGAAVYRRESVGLNSLENNELVALNLNLGFQRSGDQVFIDSFDFLKIKEFKTMYIAEAGENPWSWHVRVGVDRIESDNKTSFDYVSDGGIGLVGKLSNYGIYYGFFNVSIHSVNDNFRSGPKVGIVLGKNDLKLKAEYGLEFGLEYYESIDTVDASLQYQISKTSALQLFYQKNVRDRMGLTYIYYW